MNIDEYFHKMWTSLVPPPPRNYKDWTEEDRESFFEYMTNGCKRMQIAFKNENKQLKAENDILKTLVLTFASIAIILLVALAGFVLCKL